ncbi:MAG: PilZ domain-containing protein [Terriglobales bacterium]
MSEPLPTQHPEQALPERLDKRIQVALPLRVTYWDHDNKPCPDMACTYDISPRGARITGLRSVQEAGDIIAIERTRNNKTFCRVIWVGKPNSELRGQVGIECVETERMMWGAELRDMEEIYDPILRETDFGRLNSEPQDSNRRRRSRFLIIDGTAELQNQSLSAAPTEVVLKDLSEGGCLITGKHAFAPGTDLKVELTIANYALGMRGQAKHAAQGLGIEFREIRKGDRQMLQFLLRKLAEKKLEESFELELQPR